MVCFEIRREIPKVRYVDGHYTVMQLREGLVSPLQCFEQASD